MANNHNHTLSSNLPLALVRIVQLVVSLVVLGICAAEFSIWKGLYCDTPKRLIANLALAVTGFVIVLYLLLTSSLVNKQLHLPWHHFVQLVLDVLLVGLWIAAGILAVETCADLCSSCDSGYNRPYGVAYANKLCTCYSRFGKRAEDLFVSHPTTRVKRAEHAAHSASFAAKMVFDWLAFTFALAALAMTLLYIILHRRRQQNPAPVASQAEKSAPVMEHPADYYTQPSAFNAPSIHSVVIPTPPVRVDTGRYHPMPNPSNNTEYRSVSPVTAGDFMKHPNFIPSPENTAPLQYTQQQPTIGSVVRPSDTALRSATPVMGNYGSYHHAHTLSTVSSVTSGPPGSESPPGTHSPDRPFSYTTQTEM